MKTCVVTGAGGFVGGAVARALAARGDNVVGVVRSLRSGISTGVPPVAVLACGDVADARFMRELIARYEPDEVYHYAASSIVRQAVTDPLGAARANVMGTAALLEACRGLAKRPRVLISSSDKVYGESEQPLPETAPLRPQHVYDATKAAADMIARAYCADAGVDVVLTRSCNIFGPGDLNWSRLIPGACRALVEFRCPTVFAGAMAREFVHVEDYVAAALLVAEKGVVGSAYNVGTGDVLTPAMVVAQLFAVAAGNDERFKETLEKGELEKPSASGRPSGFGELSVQTVDASRLRELGWSPAGSFDGGLYSTYRWYLDYLRR